MKAKGKLSGKILTLICGITVLGCFLLSATFSWFNFGTEIIGRDIRMGVEDIPQICIEVDSGDGKTEYLNTLSLKAVCNMFPICGNGIVFFSPYMSVSDLPLSHINGISVFAEAPVSYNEIFRADSINPVTPEFVYSADFTLSSDSDADIYLGSESFILPAENQSTGVSRADYLCGALRCAILEKSETGGYMLKCIWIPNSGYEYSKDNGSFTENGLPESEYIFVNTAAGDSLSVEYSDAGYSLTGDVRYIWNPGKCDIPITSVDSGKKKFRLVIWLDGTDRECTDGISAFANGAEFRLNLTFEAKFGTVTENE